MYDHTKQYRCTIIRGKSQYDMDNLLPLYAKIIDTICPCHADKFPTMFSDALGSALRRSTPAKTLSNHRTEIAGKLFGMYYRANDDTVYPSERTLKFISDGDTPAFFKDICYKMQFPNGSQKFQTIKDRVANQINIRQFPFLLKVMLLAKSSGLTLSKKEIGYYILNSLNVLQGVANPLEVYDFISKERANGVKRELRSGSHDQQHINEQINLLELANLVIVNDGEVKINPKEITTIQLFADKYNEKPLFDVYSYDLDILDMRRKFYSDWDDYFSKLSDMAGSFETTAEALSITPKSVSAKEDVERSTTVQIGDEGERYVYEYEKRRVTEFNFRLSGKVIHLGKTRGLGYDIQSVVAKPGDTAEFVKYIEVKATKRITAPKMDDSSWIDTVNITRNEWVAAQQHRGYYSVFRVYFTRDAVTMFVITDIAGKNENGTITAVPLTYRVDFGKEVVDEVISTTGGIIFNA